MRPGDERNSRPCQGASLDWEVSLMLPHYRNRFAAAGSWIPAPPPFSTELRKEGGTCTSAVYNENWLRQRFVLISNYCHHSGVASMSKILFCYRQDALPELAERIYIHLCEEFGTGRVVRDVPPGTNLLKYCDETITKDDIVLIAAGGEWVPRLNNIYDFVRLQIDTALRRKIVIVPVLLEDALMPEAGSLPESLRPLLLIQAAQIREANFDSDIASLTGGIKGELPPALSMPPKKVDKSKKQNRKAIKDGWLSTPTEFRLSLYILSAVILVIAAYFANSVGWRVIQITIFIVLAFYIARFSIVRKAALEYLFSLMLAFGGAVANSNVINSAIGWVSGNIHDNIPGIDQKDIATAVTMIGIAILLVISALLWKRSE
jgi:hypothetical protein